MTDDGYTDDEVEAEAHRILTPDEVGDLVDVDLYVDPEWHGDDVPAYEPVPIRDLVPEPPEIDLPDAAVEFVERMARAVDDAETVWRVIEAHTAKLNRLEARIGYPDAADAAEVDGWAVPLPHRPGDKVEAFRSITERLDENDERIDRIVEALGRIVNALDERVRRIERS